MTLYPVITRELREQARLPMTYWTRPLGVAVMLTIVLTTQPDMLFSVKKGFEIYRLVHLTLFATVWLVVPLLAADCISRERREGTLGLLFLTPLKAWEIVAAKMFTHGLRSAALCLAIMPVLALTMLLGGVAWNQVVTSQLFLAASLAWALAAGTLASALCRERNRSMILALGFSGLFLAAASKSFQIIVYATQSPLPGFGQPIWGPYSGYLLGWRNNEEASMLLGLNWLMHASFALPKAGLILLAEALLTLLAILLAASLILMRGQQEKQPARWKLWLENFFCAPAYATGFYHRWLARGLERNPIGWLEKRRWGGRIGTWIWLAVAGVLLASVFQYHDLFVGQGGRSFFGLFFLGMMMHLAIVASGSFMRERANGVMELLLISPLNERQVLEGRLRGIYGQCLLPAALMMAAQGLALLLTPAWARHSSSMAQDAWRLPLVMAANGVHLLAIPIVGLYFSLCFRHYLAALAATLITSLVGPWGVCILLQQVAKQGPMPWIVRESLALEWLIILGGIPMLWLGLLGGILLFRLHRRLVTRQFSVQV